MYPILERFVNDQNWLDTLGDPLQQYLRSVFSNAGSTGKQVKNLLNGTWLGHPLHPVITDVPVGAWTMALIFDTAASASGNEALGVAADISVATGLTAAVGAAATGFTDWSDTYGKQRKVGLLHGVLMVATTTFYLFSLIARRSGKRSTGITFSNLGAALLTAGAYLGGDEVYELGYSVNHTAFEQPPSKFTAVMAEDDLEPGKPAKADAKGVPVVLVKEGDQIYALSDTCVHAGCSLAGGTIEDHSIICPCHGSQFDLRDGSVINGPATTAEPHYDVRVRDGQIEVRLAQT